MPHGDGIPFTKFAREPSRLIDDNRPVVAPLKRNHPLSEAPYLAIADAVSFHDGIRTGRQQKWLLHLRDYWARRLVKHERVQMHTRLKSGVACGLATAQVDSVESTAPEVAKQRVRGAAAELLLKRGVTE